MNHSNNDKRPSAESKEGRPSIKENAGQPPHVPDSEREGRVPGIGGRAESSTGKQGDEVRRSAPPSDRDLLRESFYSLKRKAASGVDGVTWPEYETGLEDRLVDLHGRVHRGAYRALPSRRVYIKKEDGRQRPLGVAALEDKLVQYAVATILNQIYEEDFLGIPYGFRPGAASMTRWMRCRMRS